VISVQGEGTGKCRDTHKRHAPWLIDGLWLAARQLSAGLLESAESLEPTKRKFG
jgi:hypothetical protein